MAKKRRTSKRAALPAGIRWLGLILLALGLFQAIALATYSAPAFREAVTAGRGWIPGDWIADFAEVHAGVHTGWLSGVLPNLGGGLGVLSAATGIAALGWTLVWFVPLTLLAWGWNRLARRSARPLAGKTLAGVPLVCVIATLLAAVPPEGIGGGALGRALWQVIGGLVGPAGGILALLVAGFGLLALEVRLADERTKDALRVTAQFLGRVLAAVGRALLRLGAAFVEWMRTAWVREDEADDETLAEDLPAKTAAKPRRGLFRRKPQPEPEPEAETHSSPLIVDASRARPAEANPAPAPPAAAPALEPAPTPEPVPATSATPAPATDETKVVTASGSEDARHLDVDPRQDVEAAVLEARRLAKQGQAAALKKAKRGRMVIPGTEILDDVPETGPPVAETELLENSRILTETLQDFGISGKVGEVHPGPVITRYEFQPGPGVKVVQINNRQDDLALKLRATRIRILASQSGRKSSMRTP